MNPRERVALIGRKTRQRLVFTLIVMTLYLSFALNYVGWGRELIASLTIGSIPGALVMFVALILVFISLELVFLFLNRNDSSK